jgi:hypothetical protein
MAIPALGAIVPALARAVPTVVQGVARTGLAAVRGLARGVGGAAKGVAKGVGKGLGGGSGGGDGESNGKGLMGLLGNPLKKIGGSFLSLTKNIKPLQLGGLKLSKVFQFLGKGVKSLNVSGLASASSINDLSSSLIGMIPVIGETAQKFIGFAEGIANTVVNTLTGLPNFLQSKFGGIISLVKSYSPAQAKQVEIAFGQMRATIGRYLVPLAPMIRNIVLNVTKFVKDGLSKINVKKAFKWIVFLMFLAVGIVIGTVKLIIRVINGIREFFSGGLRGMASKIWNFLQSVLAWIVKWTGYLLRKIPSWLVLLIKYILRGLGWLLKQIPGLMVWGLKELPGALKRLAIYIVGLVKDLVIGIVHAVVYYLPQIGEEIINFLADAWESIKQGWRELIDWVVDSFKSLANSIWEALKSILPDWLVSGLESVGNFISDAWEGITGFVSDVWDGAKQLASDIGNFVSNAADAVGEAAQQLWNEAKDLVPDSIKEDISSAWNTITEGVSSIWNWFDRTFSTGSEKVGQSSQPPQEQPPPEQPQAQEQQGQTQAQTEGSSQGATQQGAKESGTPESMLQGVADFFNELGLEDFGSFFGDMANMFEGLFKDVDTSDFSFEAKEGVQSSIEDIGKQARQAALGANKKPEEKTAEATKETSQNTSAIKESTQGLVSTFSGKEFTKLAQEADANAKAIELLNKTNREGVEAGEREKMVIIEGFDALAQKQELTNELLMRMANSQKLIADMERSKNYSFSRLSNRSQ